MQITTQPFLRARFSAIFASILLVIFSVVLGIMLHTKTATAAASTTINFQARLMTNNGAVVPDGNYNVEFKLYDTLTSSGSSQGSCTGDSTCLWTETRTTTNKVRVANGYLTVELGSITALPAIDWSQNLYLTMNIGGTGSPGWDGEMSPRLHLTAVPHAFTADKATTLSATDSGNTSTLSFIQPTANNSILLPNASGTVCLQSSASCGFVTGAPGDYIQNNQSATPQQGNIFLQNAGSATATTMILRASSGQTGNLLQFQDSSGSVINTLIKYTGAYYSTATMGLGTLSTVPISTSLYITTQTNSNISQVIRAKSGQVADLLQIQTSSGYPIVSVQSSGNTLSLGNVTTTSGQGIQGNLVFADGSISGFGATLNTATLTANRAIVLPDASGTICLQGAAACGFAAATGAAGYIQNQNSVNQTADFRVSGTGRANTSIMTPLLQPTTDGTTALKMQNIAGTVTALAADTTNGRITIGANTAAQESLDVVGNLQVRDAITATKSYRLRTSGGALDFEGSGANLYLSMWSGANYTGTQYNQIVFKSDGSSMDFARGFNVSDAAAKVGLGGNVNPQYSLDVTGDINTSTQYRIGGTVICTSAGCTPAAGSTSYIQNQNSSDQTANFRINGTGRAGTALQAPLFDTATAVALNIGTTNATAINLNKATIVTGNLTQSGGTVGLTATGTGSLTATGALTLTGGAASTWSTSAGNLTIQSATGATTLALQTAGAGTVTVGDVNSTTVNIGRGSDITRAINIGTAGSSNATTILMGSTGAASTTTIRGGTGAAAIGLTTATNGKISIDAQGTGGINALLGSNGFTTKTTTNSSTAFAIQASNNDYIFNVNTSSGAVTMGAIQSTYSGLDGTLNTPLGNLTLGSSTNALALKGSSAMTLQATSGSFTTTVGFTTPTANRTVTIADESGIVCLRTSVNCGFAAATGSANYIQNTTTLQNANIAVQAASSGSIAAVLQANAAGTGDILQLRNGAGGAVATFGYAGSALFKTTTNSLTAFQIQNASNVNVFLVDTTNGRVAIGNTAPALRFEVQDGDAAIYNNGNNARLVLGDSSTTGQYGWLQWDSANDYFRIETSGSNGLKVKDNFVSIGNIFPSKPLIVGNGTNPLFEVGATGQIQARTSTNTQNAFQLQNNLSEVFFNADSTNKRIGIGDGMVAPKVTLDVKGVIQQTGLQTSDTGAADNNKWTRLGYCTITAQYDQCLTKIEILGGQDGSTGNNSQATVSVRVKQQNALGGVPYVNVTLNDTAEVITKSDIVAVTTVNTGATTTVALYARITNTFETWWYTPVLNTGGGGTSTWDWSPFNGFAAALPAGAQTPARYGNMNANLMTIEATNANAMVIQNAGGVNKLLVADTTNMRLAVGQATAAYTLDVLGDINTSTQLRIGGTSICDTTGCTAKTGSGFYIHNQTTVQASNFWVQAAASGSVGGIIQANAAGTGDILQLKNGAGVNVGTVSSTGALNVRTSTNSASAFRVQNSLGTQVFSVDSIDNIMMLGTGFGAKHVALDIETNPYIEVVDSTNKGISMVQVDGGNSLIYHDTDMTVERVSQSANDFSVIDPGDSSALFTVDSLNSQVEIGISNAVGTLLTLDTKTGATDPTGVNGGMYYNSGLGKFRCYEGSMWRDCISGFNTITKGADQAATQSNTTPQNDTALVFSMAANTNYVIDAWIPVDTTGAANLKYTYTVPSGATLNISNMSYSSATANVTCNIIASAQACTTTIASAVNFIQVKGFIRNGANAGSLQFQFSQNVSTAASFPVVKKGATLSWHN